MHEKQIRTITALVADALAEQEAPLRQGPKGRPGAAAHPRLGGGALPVAAHPPPSGVRGGTGGVHPHPAPSSPRCPRRAGWPSATGISALYPLPRGELRPRRPEHVDGAQFYLAVLQVLLDYERQVLPFDPLMDFQFLTPQEYESCDCGREYERFLRHFRTEYRLRAHAPGPGGHPLPHAGPHRRGPLHRHDRRPGPDQAAGVDIDLALISGAAAAHDIGKYGCRPGERVPYLHYYYTDQWLLERNMGNISHIAANHSTWDLELESLSVESLCLIYADFRSKQDRDEKGQEITVLYPLDQSFQVDFVQAGQRGQQQAPPVRVRLRQGPRL